MNNQRFLKKIQIGFLLIMPLFALAGCSILQPRPAVLPPSSEARQYVLIQALAQLALEKTPNDKKSLTSHAKKLNKFRSAKKDESQLAVITLEYTRSGHSNKRVLLVPVSVTANAPSFNALQQVYKDLSGLTYTLHNIRANYLAVSFPSSQKFSDDPILFQQQLDAEQRKMIERLEELPLYENARLQLQLVGFFMNAGARDEAYLALQNAKDALLYLAEDTGDNDIVLLSQQANALESKLHKKMPYKF